MYDEKQKSKTHSSGPLSRGERLRQRFVPLSVALGGVATAAIALGMPSGSADKDPHSDAPRQAIVKRVVATGELGGAKEGWGQESAGRLIRGAVKTAASKGFAELGLPEDTDVEGIVNDIPLYGTVSEALEMADYGSALAEADDKLKLEIEVTVDDSKSVSVEVTHAEIIDVPNNQE